MKSVLDFFSIIIFNVTPARWINIMSRHEGKSTGDTNVCFTHTQVAEGSLQPGCWEEVGFYPLAGAGAHQLPGSHQGELPVAVVPVWQRGWESAQRRHQAGRKGLVITPQNQQCQDSANVNKTDKPVLLKDFLSGLCLAEDLLLSENSRSTKISLDAQYFL